MKQQTIKDFIAQYSLRNENKLVLIKDSIWAGKPNVNNYWKAHAGVLAMVDENSGQVISEPCGLCWPLTEEEKAKMEYCDRFVKGRIYRVKVRRWKGDIVGEPQWYVTKVLEENVPCPALEEIWAEYLKPVVIEDELLGCMTLDRESNTFCGKYQWMGKEISISLDIDADDESSWTLAQNVMRDMAAEQERWSNSLSKLAAQELTSTANDWLADDDNSERDCENEPITEDEFSRRIILMELCAAPDGSFTAWYNDDDMFWGHSICVEGSLEEGPFEASVQG